ncbi:hypothetical protein [Marinomonas posidonica]|uniref:hypothetical protein n=1 Tax=Marinomonas posidonica TaxID=936476 RepID=UPI003734C1B3
MPTTSSIEQSYEQLKAFVLKRPPESIRAAINKSWVSEKATLEAMKHDRTTSKRTTN